MVMHAGVCPVLFWSAALGNVDTTELDTITGIEAFQPVEEVRTLPLRFFQWRRLTRIGRSQVIVPYPEIVDDELSEIISRMAVIGREDMRRRDMFSLGTFFDGELPVIHLIEIHVKEVFSKTDFLLSYVLQFYTLRYIFLNKEKGKGKTGEKL